MKLTPEAERAALDLQRARVRYYAALRETTGNAVADAITRVFASQALTAAVRRCDAYAEMDSRRIVDLERQAG